jgi:hypothetical protein
MTAQFPRCRRCGGQLILETLPAGPRGWELVWHCLHCGEERAADPSTHAPRPTSLRPPR